MAKSIFLFKISDSFMSLQKENNLEIILDIFIKSKQSDFYLNQFNLIVSNLDCNVIKNNLINYFKNRNNFIIKDNSLILYNKFKDMEETICFYDNYLKIIISENTSLFLEYLCLYFVDLVAIEIDDEKIYPLHLVKSSVLV